MHKGVLMTVIRNLSVEPLVRLAWLQDAPLT